jgi:rhombotail lipoprotein
MLEGDKAMIKRMMGAALVAALLAGCMSMWTGGFERSREGASSSLVDFLYPGGEQPPAVDDRLPYLELPIRVGIAFVPSNSPLDPPAAEKQRLLEEVASAFRDRSYVESIEAIPDIYMRSASGIVGMQQVAAMYDVDAMALVSYDQIAFSGERDSAILYWTIVGALVVKGNTNEVQTMIDTAVFDVATARLLFRAPGIHGQQENTTLVDSERDLRELRSEGFAAATDNMIVNLDAELSTFREAVESGERAQVAWRNGEPAGGSAGPALIALLLVSALLRAGRRQPLRVRGDRRR